MFYSGVYINNKNATASIVMIEKSLKTARKLYRICYIRKIDNCYTGDVLATVMKNISVDHNFIRRKKVFSQDMRPPKITRTPPAFFIASESNNEEVPGKIRDKNFSIEGVIYESNDKWHKKELRPMRYGCNYYVNPKDIKKALITTCSGERLQFEENSAFANELKRELPNFLNDETADSDLIAALSLPVWFCERIKQIKRY